MKQFFRTIFSAYTKRQPSKHTTSLKRRYNVVATSWRCSNVVTTSLRRCVFAGNRPARAISALIMSCRGEISYDLFIHLFIYVLFVFGLWVNSQIQVLNFFLLCGVYPVFFNTYPAMGRFNRRQIDDILLQFPKIRSWHFMQIVS